MSSLIVEDLNSFSFLSIIVLKSSVLTSLLSSWTAAVDYLVAERLFGIVDKYMYIYKYKTSILHHYLKSINNYSVYGGIIIN